MVARSELVHACKRKGYEREYGYRYTELPTLLGKIAARKIAQDKPRRNLDLTPRNTYIRVTVAVTKVSTVTLVLYSSTIVIQWCLYRSYS